MDPEHGYGGSHHSFPNRRTGAQRRLDVISSSNSTGTTTSLGRVIIACCLGLLVLGVLPASFVFWACLVFLVFTCLRLRLQAQAVQRALEQDDAQSADAARLPPGVGAAFGHGGPIIRMIPGGGGLLVLHADPHVALEHINMRLRHLDEEMGVAGYDMYARHAFRAAAAAGSSGLGARLPSVSDADIAALPCYPYKPPRAASTTAAAAAFAQAPAPAVPSSAAPSGPSEADSCKPSPHSSPLPSVTAPSSFSAQPHAGPPIRTAGSPASAPSSGPGPAGLVPGPVATHDRLALAASGAPPSSPADAACRPNASGGGEVAGAGAGRDGGQGLTCPVCLDPVAEGAIVMTLPCLHQFHASCVTPWLRQQGQLATCPMCKTPVFR